MSDFKRIVVAITPPIIIKAAKRGLRRADTTPELPDVPMPSFVSPDLGAYSQYGEDLIIDAITGLSAVGFYVDVGANDPVVLNNTKRFHTRGWHGLNVEPNPDLMSRIQEDRPADDNLNTGVGAEDRIMDFYRIDPNTLSTFDASAADDNIRAFPGAEIVEVIPVQVTTLTSLFSKHVPRHQVIDFMSMDVEGGELAALGGNDWEVWRPRLVLL